MPLTLKGKINVKQILLTRPSNCLQKLHKKLQEYFPSTRYNLVFCLYTQYHENTHNLFLITKVCKHFQNW